MITKTKILAFCGDPILTGLLKQELSDDYEIACALPALNTLREALYNERPDFIILDIMMPNLDGIELCLQLRQCTQTPTMMLSTWGAGNGQVRGLNLNSKGYLTEPFGTDELKKRINKTIRRNAVAMTDKSKNTLNRN